MAEAMYLEKPVIASGYSGNLDFMNEDNSYLIEGDEIYVDEFSYQGIYLPNQYKWFEPNWESTFDQMERCINDKFNDKKLKNAKEVILRKYSKKSLNKFLNENLS
jgi:glycosyltransferase involved in cell wall biosynthesis